MILAFFAAKDADGSWEVFPSDMTDPDERDVIDETKRTKLKVSKVLFCGREIPDLDILVFDHNDESGWVPIEAIQ